MTAGKDRTAGEHLNIGEMMAVSTWQLALYNVGLPLPDGLHGAQQLGRQSAEEEKAKRRERDKNMSPEAREKKCKRQRAYYARRLSPKTNKR